MEHPIESAEGEVAAWFKTLDHEPLNRTAPDGGRVVYLPSPWIDSPWRRLLDCSVAASALLLLLPVLIACALLVYFSSPGPILFRQRRTGRYGTEFCFYKFRSMRDAPAAGGATHTVCGDCRITRAGALLRRYKLDELPQFWNVLKGDMSLVGPRPKLPAHEALFLTCRPGITGAATLAFRSEEQMLADVPPLQVDAIYEKVFKPAKAELDLHYMRNATFTRDMELLLRTVLGCISVPSDPWAELNRIKGQEAPLPAANGQHPATATAGTRISSSPAAAVAD